MCRKPPFFGWLRRLRPRHRHQEQGLAAVEFALIAPAVFLLLIGTVEMALMMFAQNVLESATFNASRIGKTGYVGTEMTREQTIRQAISDRADAFFDLDRIAIDTRSYNQFSQIGQPEPYIDANGNGMRDDGENFTDVNGNGTYDTDMGGSDAGEAQNVVVYTVTYPWLVMTPIMSNLLANENGFVELSARIVVRNEPY